MSNPVIVREGNDGSNGVLIALIVVVVIGLAIRAYSSGRMDTSNNDPKTVDVNIEAPNMPATDDMPTVEDTTTTNDMPATDDMPTVEDTATMN